MGSARCFIDHHGYCITVSRADYEVRVLNDKFLGNEEPGTMMPGHCFTIEVNTLATVIL
jgi:hypothetical protein